MNIKCKRKFGLSRMNIGLFKMYEAYIPTNDIVL